MTALNIKMAGHGVTASDLQELTTAELEAISGGFLHIVVGGIAAGIFFGVIQQDVPSRAFAAIDVPSLVQQLKS